MSGGASSLGWAWSEDVEWVPSNPPKHPFTVTSELVEANDGSYEARAIRGKIEGGGPRYVVGAPAGNAAAEVASSSNATDGDVGCASVLEEGDDLDTPCPMSAEERERILLLPDIPEDAKDDERNFMAIKPWIGSMYPPKEYIRDPKNPHNVFDETHNNWSEPEVKLELDYIFGYRARDCRDNLHWIDEKHVIFPAAAVGVILDLDTTDEDFYFGHDDDIVCLTYHASTNMVASGSIGARDTVRLCLWKANTKMDGQETLHCIMGFHWYAVLAVAFNPQGTILATVGMDEHHSVALYDVESGTLLACAPADKNRLVHCRFNTASSVCSASHFVTVGVRHIAFWTPKDTTLPVDKTGKRNYYMTTSDHVEARLDFQRGYGCREMDREGFCFYSLDFSAFHALVGASNGNVYLFNAKAWNLEHMITDSTHRVLSIKAMDDAHTTFAVGCGAGRVHFYEVGGTEVRVDVRPAKGVLPLGDTVIDMNLLDECTNNKSNVLVNSVRSIDFDPKANKLLVGTILHHIYSVDLGKSSSKQPVAAVLLGAHWCNLNHEELGELWGIAAHPSKQWVVTCNDDCTVRLWDLVKNVELARRHTPGRGYRCTVSQDGSMIAMCHRNGTFMVFSGDLKQVVWPNTRFSKCCGCDIQFSPSGQYLAIAGNYAIAIYTITEVTDAVTGEKRKHFSRSGVCRGHTSRVDSFDWNITSTILKSASIGYDLIWHIIPDCDRVAFAKDVADEVWYSETCVIGWSVQGIWPRYADGTDINSTGVSHSHKWLCTTDDWGHVKIYNYPCIGGGLDRDTGLLKVRPSCHTYVGHCSHVTNCVWTYDDTYVCTTGGADLCMFCWKVNYGPGEALKPKEFFNAAKLEKVNTHIQSAQISKENTGSDFADGAPAGTAPSLELPPECYMCHYEYFDDVTVKCPRCYAPRCRGKSEIKRAWNGKLSRNRVPVKARFKHPTASFANYTCEQQAQRRRVDETVKDGVWHPGSMTRRTYRVGYELSDSDEESCKRAIMGQTTPAAVSGPKPAPKRTKRTNGPDFCDL